METSAPPCPSTLTTITGVEEARLRLADACLQRVVRSRSLESPILSYRKSLNDLARGVFRSSKVHGVVGRDPVAITREVPAVASILFIAVLLLPFVTAASPYVLCEARDCARTGRGRHRRVVHGRHAARGGR